MMLKTADEIIEILEESFSKQYYQWISVGQGVKYNDSHHEYFVYIQEEDVMKAVKEKLADIENIVEIKYVGRITVQA